MVILIEDSKAKYAALDLKEKLEVVKMNSQKNNVNKTSEHELYDIEYSERTSYGRLKE